MIKNDPAWNQGNYSKNPDGARLAALTYSLFLHTATWYDHNIPTREAAEKTVTGDPGSFAGADANDFIYMMELNNGFDAWSQIDRVHCPVMIINMRADMMVPVELQQAQKVTERLKNATYLEVADESEYGHGALGRTSQVWGPKLKAWLEGIRKTP
jgi:homoserine O-acetyltransferase